MKPLRYFFFVSLFLLMSCGSDDPNVNGTDDPDGTPMDDDVEAMEEVEITLVNAFPNLSFAQPLDLQSANDGSNRLFVAEKGGTIHVFDNDSNVQGSAIFLSLPNISTTSEQGLLGFVFHPNFASNGHFYVCYTPSRSVSRISRFTVTADGNSASTTSELVLLEIPQPQTNHNGGQLAFGQDGFLYIAMGDGGGSGDPQNNAQNNSNLLGTILRIDIDNQEGNLNYSIPTDNPFLNISEARNEIYAYGLRNPWRMSFDTETGDLWTGDVGQNAIEEIDIITIGSNYGWRLFEGTACFSGNCDDTNLVAPIFEYTQDNGDRSITGGYVYRGASNSSLFGRYIYGDFVSGRVWALEADGSNNELLLETGLNIASFGTDAQNELYLCAFDGRIYRLEEETNPI